jgi:hypothetical protein
MISNKHKALYRGVALFFVMFVFADIFCSQPCSEQFELLGIPLANVEQSHAEPFNTVLQQTALPSKEKEPEQSELPDDDCLTWCPHVLPGLLFTIVTESRMTLTTNEIVLLLPLAPSQSTFHPPRFV